MATTDRVVAALLEEAAAAELLPNMTTKRKSRDAQPKSVTKFHISTPRGMNAGQAVFPIHQTWLTLTPFTRTPLNEIHPIAIDPRSDASMLLQRRMRFLELLVRVSMTPKYDWQTTLLPSALANDRFDWGLVFRPLLGDAAWEQPHTQRALATLRWHHPRFLIQWPYDSLPDNFPELLEIFLMGAIPTTTMDPTATDAIKNDALRGFLTDTRHQRRVVELGVEIGGGVVTASLLRRLIAVFARVGEIQAQRNASITFRVTTLRFYRMGSLSVSAMEELGDLLRDSAFVHINEIQLTQLTWAQDLNLQRCLASLIAPPTSNAPPFSSSKLRRVWLDNESKPFAVVGSAMRHDTTNIQELRAMYTAGDMNNVAAWLAFGVFHCDSQSRVRGLSLSIPWRTSWDMHAPSRFAVCSPQWIEIFTRVLSQVASAQDLAPLDPPSATVPPLLEELRLPNDKRVFVNVKPNTKVRRQPHAKSPVVAMLFSPADGAEDDDDEELLHFQVIRKLPGWLAVVVPGLGAGWILWDAVVKEFTCESRVPLLQSTTTPRHCHHLKSLAWESDPNPRDASVREQHADSLVELLALIGEPLEVLQLPSMWLMNTHVARILKYCPNLRELNLYGNRITDLAPLVRAYELGICKISSLNVAQIFTDQSRIVQQCAAMLELCNQQETVRDKGSSRSPPRTKRPTIQQLVVRLASLVSDAELVPLFHVIQRDTKLEYVRVHCSQSCEETLMTMMALHASSGNAIVPRSRPLPLPCKLAMLSVVHHKSTQHSALSSLATGVLELIFGLAGNSQDLLVDIQADAIAT